MRLISVRNALPAAVAVFGFTLVAGLVGCDSAATRHQVNRVDEAAEQQKDQVDRAADQQAEGLRQQADNLEKRADQIENPPTLPTPAP